MLDQAIESLQAALPEFASKAIDEYKEKLTKELAKDASKFADDIKSIVEKKTAGFWRVLLSSGLPLARLTAHPPLPSTREHWLEASGLLSPLPQVVARSH